MPQQCRVVQGGSVRLPLSGDDWIDVKEELNAGEYVDQLQDMADRKSFVTILTYVLAWSLIGPDGKPLPWDPDGPDEVRRSTVRSLNKATARELTAVLNRHEAAQEAALDAKKKAPASSDVSNPRSTSAAP